MRPSFKKKQKPHAPDFFRGRKVDWEQHESDVAERSGGRRTPGSGNKPGIPGDTSDQHYLRECKATKKAGISISPKWLRKIVEAAISRGKVPLIEIRLEGQTLPVPTDWVLVPATDFEVNKRG